MRQQSEQLRAQGHQVLEAKLPQRLETLAGDGAARLFDQFDEPRQGCQQAK